MAFHGIMVLRDEGDIIAQTLEHLMTWCDSLTLLDTGSTDGTWDLVHEAARRDRRITPLARTPVTFHNGLRAAVFQRARHRFHPGDWIARLDADEFYHAPPPLFIRERLRPAEGRIFGLMYDFLLTRRESAAWDRGEESLADRARPIEHRRTRYVVQDFPEPRLFRYRKRMSWPADAYVPCRGGLIARARVQIRHYRWRDPVQAAQRCALRRATHLSGNRVGAHWDLNDWREWLANDDDPRLLRHTPGAPLPDPALTNHLPPPARAAAQGLFYRSGVVHLADWLTSVGTHPHKQPGALLATYEPQA